MKTINKVLLTTAIVLIPLGIYAQDKFEEHKDFDNKASKHYKDSDDRKNSFNEYLMEKGVNYELEGKLESKPTDGLNGIWTISGTKILVDNTTFIKQSKKLIKVGDTIEVQAKRTNNNIVAIILEQEDDFFN